MLKIYTTSSQAAQINSIIKEYINFDSIITDATACIGGNTVFFEKDFKIVIAIEKDPDVFKILKSNTKKETNVILKLDDINVLDIINNIYHNTRFVALKVPNNFDDSQISEHFWNYKIYTINTFKKNNYKLIIFYKKI